jgi:hypothetical protein
VSANYAGELQSLLKSFFEANIGYKLKEKLWIDAGGLELQQFSRGIFRQLFFFLLNKTDTVRGFYSLMLNVFFFYYTTPQYIQK